MQEVDYVNVRAHRVWLIVFTGQRVSGAFEILKKGDAFSEGSTFLGNHSLPCGLQKISAYCNAVPTVMRVCGMNPFCSDEGSLNVQLVGFDRSRSAVWGPRAI